jgi:hypothetical protein
MSSVAASTYTEKSMKSLTASAVSPSRGGAAGCSTLRPSSSRMSGRRTVCTAPGTMS